MTTACLADGLEDVCCMYNVFMIMFTHFTGALWRIGSLLSAEVNIPQQMDSMFMDYHRHRWREPSWNTKIGSWAVVGPDSHAFFFCSPHRLENILFVITLLPYDHSRKHRSHLGTALLWDSAHSINPGTRSTDSRRQLVICSAAQQRDKAHF